MGLHYWLRLADGYKRFAPALRAIAIAVPLLALAGFVVAGRATGDIMSDPEAFAALKARSHWPSEVDSATLAWLRDSARIAFAAVLISIVGIHLMRRPVRALRRGRGRLTYVGGPTIELKPGMTVLEASRSAGVPHASVCGGRARCSTCRVKIESGLDTLPHPVGAEAITLESIEAPPNVRLACQVRPTSSLTVAIVAPPATPGPIRVDFIEIKEVVAAHVRAILAGELVDLASSDPSAIARWAQGKVTYPLTIRDLGPQGFTLMGGRLDYLLNRPAAALVYARGERPITVFALPRGDSDALAIRGQRNGYHVLAWADAGIGYFATSDLAPEELDRLEVLLTSVEAHSTSSLLPASNTLL
jgi:ferredoxin